jgi:prepilin-type processing-associated H-X9-DG protein
VVYLGEVNYVCKDIKYNDFQCYDTWKPQHWTFDGYIPNDVLDTRFIHANDQRHQGRTNVLYFDGHVSTVEIHPDNLPIQAYNPLVPKDW